jgi:uncharacterized membrane protein YciS (DUF1049 family)
MTDIVNSILATVFTAFASVMVKLQTMKYKIPIFLAVGLILGLIIAWGIWPAEFKNGTPGHLRTDYQIYYLNWAAETYAQTRDINKIQQILGLDIAKNPWVENPETFEEAINLAIAQNPDRATLLQQMKQEIDMFMGTGAEEEGEEKGISIATLFGYLIVVLAIVAAGLFLLSRLSASRQQQQISKPVTPEKRGIPGAGLMEEAPPPPVMEEGEEPPLKSFTTTYVLGDDFFDPSFSIEMGSEFLGECGVGISETIGSGDPKKVTALEAWLFDKSDIRTVTTVLASEYAMGDEDLLAKLEPKGEVKEIHPGMEVTLETTALRVSATIKEVEYAQGDLPDRSFYQRVSIELRAWVKQDT